MKKFLIVISICLSYCCAMARINLPIPISDGAYKVVGCSYAPSLNENFSEDDKYIDDFVKVADEKIFVFSSRTIDITLSKLVSKTDDASLSFFSELLLGHQQNMTDYHYEGYIGYYDSEFNRYKEIKQERIEFWVYDYENPYLLFWDNHKYYKLELECLHRE